MRHRLSAKLWFILTVTTFIVFGVSFGAFQLRYNQGKRQLEALTERYKALYLEIADLREDLEYAKTDDYVIEAARDSLGLIMPNEIRYVSGN